MCQPIVLNLKAFHCVILETIVSQSAATIRNRQGPSFAHSATSGLGAKSYSSFLGGTFRQLLAVKLKEKICRLVHFMQSVRSKLGRNGIRFGLQKLAIHTPLKIIKQTKTKPFLTYSYTLHQRLRLFSTLK